ncbi:MAG: 2Fe-2S iron-sulfur cluster-binding protein [Ilumatobacteraceae bacterium]
MPRVVFIPSGIAGTVDSGTTVLAAARQLGVDLDTVCGGRGICGRCQVVPSPGVHAKWGIDVALHGAVPSGDARERLSRSPPAARRQPARVLGDDRRRRRRRRSGGEPSPPPGRAQVARSGRRVRGRPVFPALVHRAR